ncbi:NirD/YgiW/YdeI family stress tolerance protein [Acinetobacter sp. 199]|uniref:NirD/YgiW/YdeI family stress tolerance protein n=1 Tax=Acinetobacter sp. 199 TaxID=3114697 RepID=UPI003A852A68
MDQEILNEAKRNVVTVAQAQQLSDETGVILHGQIVRQLATQSDEFEFKDKTGSIIIEVDDDQWKALRLKAGDQVRILGEVDTYSDEPTAIDVIQIERVK